jgi:hypothetical protein
MAILSLGGTAVAAPSKITVAITDVAKVDHNAAGNAVIDRTGQKRRIECEWGYLTNAQIATLLVAAGSTTPFFTVAYCDPQTNAPATATCYAQERNMGVQKYAGTTPTGWRDVKITFQEQ